MTIAKAETEKRQELFKKGLKQCTRKDCQNPNQDANGTLPLSEFRKNKNIRDGLHSECKHCGNKYVPMSAKSKLRKEMRGKGYKWCNECQSFNPFGEFHNDGSRRDGLSATCKICKNNATAIQHKQYNQTEHGKQIRANWYKTEKGRKWQRQYRREYMRKRRQTQKQKDWEYQYRRSEKRRKIALEYVKSPKGKKASQRYYQSPKGILTSKRASAARRSRKSQAGGLFTQAEWKQLCIMYDYRCLACGKQFSFDKLTVDHVIPISLGGSSNIDNLQPLCKPCNSSKGTKTIDYRTKDIWWEQLPLFKN